MSESHDGVVAWVRRSCDEQGIPVHVTDAGVVVSVVNLVNTTVTPITAARGRHREKDEGVLDLATPTVVREARAQGGAADAAGSPREAL